MIRYPALPSGYTVFCDDIRNEASGKSIYIGVYNSHILIEAFPAILPKFSCAVSLHEEIDSTESVTIKVIQDTNGLETTLVELTNQFPKTATHHSRTDEFTLRENRVLIEISPLPLSGPCTIKVRAFRGDDEIRLGAVKVATRELYNAEMALHASGAKFS